MKKSETTIPSQICTRGSHGCCSGFSGLLWKLWYTAMNSFRVEEQISDIVLSMVLSILHFGPYGQDDALGMTPEKQGWHSRRVAESLKRRVAPSRDVCIISFRAASVRSLRGVRRCTGVWSQESRSGNFWCRRRASLAGPATCLTVPVL